MDSREQNAQVDKQWGRRFQDQEPKKPRYEISGVHDTDGKFVDDKHDGINTRAFIG